MKCSLEWNLVAALISDISSDLIEEDIFATNFFFNFQTRYLPVYATDNLKSGAHTRNLRIRTNN